MKNKLLFLFLSSVFAAIGSDKSIESLKTTIFEIENTTSSQFLGIFHCYAIDTKQAEEEIKNLLHKGETERRVDYFIEDKDITRRIVCVYSTNTEKITTIDDIINDPVDKPLKKGIVVYSVKSTLPAEHHITTLEKLRVKNTLPDEHHIANIEKLLAHNIKICFLAQDSNLIVGMQKHFSGKGIAMSSVIECQEKSYFYHSVALIVCACMGLWIVFLFKHLPSR